MFGHSIMAISIAHFLITNIAFVMGAARQPKCVPIQPELCANIGYNSTRFPNFANSENERSAIDEFQSFQPLISIRCSEELRFFLCASYFPLCNEKVPDLIGPCQPLCKRVQSKCLNVLKGLNYPWPINLECSKFPEENNEEHMCMEGQNNQQEQQNLHEFGSMNSNQQKSHQRRPESSVLQPDTSGSYPVCKSDEHVYMNRTALCVPKCYHSHGYSPADIHSTRSALIIGSILSFTLTTVCLLSSCFGRKMVKERKPIDNTLFYSAFCFAFSALVYMLSIFQRDKIACFSYQIHELFVVPGIPHVPCTLIATLIYYSGTAARLWWLCTCAAWRWSIRNEQNNKKVSSFLYNAHVFCWATPFILLTIALMAQAAHAEPLSGICLIGAVGRGNFQMFVLLRDLVVVVASVLLLGSGCLTSSHSLTPTNTNSFVSNNGIGILCAILPMAQTFWFLAAVQHLYVSINEPIIGVGSMAKLLADPSLGALLGGSFFVYILHACWGDSNAMVKNGYQVGRPLYPTPSTLHHPQGNLTSTTSVPITSSSQRSSANIVPNGSLGSGANMYSNGQGFIPPIHPPPPPPLATLRQIGNC